MANSSQNSPLPLWKKCLGFAVDVGIITAATALRTKLKLDEIDRKLKPYEAQLSKATNDWEILGAALQFQIISTKEYEELLHNLGTALNASKKAHAKWFSDDE